MSRIGTGLVGTLIGCALLAWIPLSIQAQSFGEMVSACTTAPDATPAVTCTSVKTLILLGVPVLLGFSERTLPFFEQRIFGKTGLPLLATNPLKKAEDMNASLPHCHRRG